MAKMIKIVALLIIVLPALISASDSITNVLNSAPTTADRVCPTGSWWAPAPQTTWQWQLTGTIDTSFNVQMYDIDLFDNTAATIQTLHNQGRVVICYFSTQYENWRPDAAAFTTAVIGKPLDGWAGENYVDIRSDVVRKIMSTRLDLAVSKGCDGVEPDNVDGYEAKTGFPLTAADQISFNNFIAAQAHARGISVGLKNDIDQAKTLEPNFDWALNEECNKYKECSTLDVFITKGKAVFNCEYSGSATTVCPKMVTEKFSTIFKSLDLDAKINTECCTSQPSGCAAVAHKCITAKASTDIDENAIYTVQALEFKEPQEMPVGTGAPTAYACIALTVALALAACNL